MPNKPKLVVSLISSELEYQVMQGEDAQRSAARAGFDVEVLYAKNNPTLQLQQLYRFVHAPEADRPLAIIIHSIAGDGLPRLARDVAKAGIGWILINREAAYIDELRAEYSRLPISIVTMDQREIGRIQGRQWRTLLASGGNVLYVQGPGDTWSARERLAGAQEATAGSGIHLKVLEGDWTEASGEKAVTAWLRLSTSQQEQIQLIAAQNDAMAEGAKKAIAARRPEWSKLPVTGVDGLPGHGQTLVKSGEFAATVLLQSTIGPAIELITSSQRSGKPVPRQLVLQPKPFPA